MKNTLLALSTSLVILLTNACELNLIETDPKEDNFDSENHARLCISFTPADKTRSSISPDESDISHVQVIVYMGGHLVTCSEADGNEDMELELRRGAYSIYAVANMEEFRPPVKETDISQSMYQISSIDEISDNIPMCWSGTVELDSGENEQMDIVLERLVSKIRLAVDTGVLEGLEIASVRLCQSATVLRPFMKGGSRVLDSSETGDGDYASSVDLSELKSGRPIYFYVLENCQGTLLPDNKDPWQKIPERIGEAAELCTYIEMKCRWLETADYEGEVTYRFYLGENATSDFDIKRNSVHHMTLYLNENSLDKICWKIDSSEMDIVRWDITSDFDDNFHTPDNFYVCEMIRIDFELDTKAEKYWSKRNYNFSLTGVDTNNHHLIYFKKPVRKPDGSYYAIGTCMSKGDFKVVMVNNETGEAVYTMNSGKVKVPKIVIGPEDIFDDEKVESLDNSINLTINGGKRTFCLYLTDDQGYNLNQGHYYGCDFDFCDWEFEIYNSTYSYKLTDKAKVSLEYGVSGSDSYAMKYSIYITNDGTDPSWNERLTGSLGDGIARLEFSETSMGAYQEHDLSLSASNITVTMKPVADEVRSLFGTEFMYVVKNKSKIPFTIKGIKENSLYDDPDPSHGLWDVVCPKFSNFISTYNLVVSRMPATYCTFDSSSAKSYIKGDEVWYAVADDGVDQSSIPKQLSLFHVLKAETTYESQDPPSITISQVLDGTSSDIEKYGNTGYRNVGMKFYYGDYLYEDYNSYDNLYTDFKYYGSLQTAEGVDLIDDIIEITISLNENNEFTAVASKEAIVNISLYGTMYAHTRCVTSQDPFDTVWGHYFKEEANFSVSGGFRLSPTPVTIGPGTLTSLLNYLRGKEYYSALDLSKVEDFKDPGYYGSTTIREYLKPYGLDLNISINPEQNTAYAIRFEGKLNYDFKTSDPITWDRLWTKKITMVPSTYSGFDDKLSRYDCPEGEVFKAETVILEPAVTFTKNHDLYYTTGK